MKKFLSKFLGSLLLIISLLFGVAASPILSTPVYADEDDLVSDETPSDIPDDEEESSDEPPADGEESSDEEESSEPTEEEVKNACQEQTGSLSWIVCPTSGLLANISDALYGAISEMLVVEPLSMEGDAPIYVVWQYARNITNILFAIFLVIVIFSQITGIGLNNYGIKRVLPRLIIAVVLVNLSFIICTLAVDASNIIGYSLGDLLSGIQDNIIMNSSASTAVSDFSMSNALAAVVSGGTIAGITISAIGGGGYIFFMLLAVLIGAVIAIVSGLITIAARQALVALLVMISPLAFVAYLLPNTEKWFSKWKDLLFRMLIFYPMFSFLFGASQLVGYAIILSANSAIGVILGIAVQIFPLFFSWSLMKMSGTILNSVNNAVRRVASPLQRGFAGWSLSKAEQSRQYHLANSQSGSAKLRRYLDYRRELRELDTKNSMDVRHGKAHERALTTASSSINRDKNGNLSWSRRANRYTANAERASIARLRAGTAGEAHQNTLSRFGDLFEGEEVQELSATSADSYLDAMQQSFLTKNNAQADQEWLLGQYLDAQSNKYTDPSRYNRLIASAAGSLGHNGESSIIGQVIAGNSAIEARRRSEARIIINKFGIPKSRFRAMILDKAYVSDEGFVTDAEGNRIEDDQYHLLAGHEYSEWSDYIYANKKTGNHISKDDYNALSAADRKNYRRVRYLDIPDDKGNPIATVFEDDAGYMKEILTDDIYIGDPINRRYLTEIGVAHVKGEKDGILRRYHSTIKGALEASGYKTHSGEVTPMITSQTNLGYITSIGQYNVAGLQSLSVAAKAGAVLQNDGWSLDTWSKIITAAASNEKFEEAFPEEAATIRMQHDGILDAFAHYFPDFDIENYRDVNGKHLSGYIEKLDEDGNFTGWEEITENDPRNGLEARKNFLKNKIIPKAATQLASMLNRKMSPNLLENQKTGTLKSLKKLLNVLCDVGTSNVDPNIPAENTLGNHANFFESQDPDTFRRQALATQRQINDIISGNNSPSEDSNPTGNNPTPSSPTPTGGSGNNGGNTPSGSGSSGSTHSSSQTSRGSSAPTGNPHRHTGVNTATRRFERQNEAQERYIARNSYDKIVDDVNGYFDMHIFDYGTLGSSLIDYFNNIESLQPFAGECVNLVDQYRHNPYAGSTIDAIHQITNSDELEAARIEELHDAIMDLIDQAETY